MISQGMSTVIDLTGKSFGYWTVIDRGPNDKRQQAFWNCVCLCGAVCLIRGADLRKYHSTNCGCIRIEKVKNIIGSKHYNWKGGKYKTKTGYIRFSFPGGKSKFEHHVVMENILGRALLPKETVHHKNGKRDNNRPENLELFSSRHKPGQKVSDLILFAVEILKLHAPEKLA